MGGFRTIKYCILVAIAFSCAVTFHVLTQPREKVEAGRRDRLLQEYDVQLFSKLDEGRVIDNSPIRSKKTTTYVTGETTSSRDLPATEPISTGFRRPSFQFLREPQWLFNDSCELEHCWPQMAHNWSMVNFIKSAANNFIRRELLRRTWSGMRHVDGGRFSTVFVIGQSHGNTEKLLLEEWQRYGDILIFDGPDDYQNMPQKTLAGMQWARDNLPHDYFYSSGDDDFMINMGRLQEIIDAGIKNVTQLKWPEFPIICTYKTIVDAAPYRDKGGVYKKWYISESEYKWPFYPKSCLGGFYTTRVSAVSELFRVSETTPHLSVDDVWITGILREKLGMPDNMVITPGSVIAHHFLGYRKKRNDIKIGFMKNEWHKILDEFKTKKICRC